jgi:hypothetical protein
MAFGVFHDDETLAFILIRHRRTDMRMIQGGGTRAFPGSVRWPSLEALPGISGIRGGRAEILGFIHHAHATAAEFSRIR